MFIHILNNYQVEGGWVVGDFLLAEDEVLVEGLEEAEEQALVFDELLVELRQELVELGGDHF